MTRYHLVSQRGTPASWRAVTGAPVTAYLSAARLRGHVPPPLPYPTLTFQGLSERPESAYSPHRCLCLITWVLYPGMGGFVNCYFGKTRGICVRPAVFQMPGLHHRRLWVGDFPGNRPFFLLLHAFHPWAILRIRVPLYAPQKAGKGAGQKSAPAPGLIPRRMCRGGSHGGRTLPPRSR